MSEDFCVGVKILLERMDTNPEEFVETAPFMRGARWGNLLSNIVSRKFKGDVRGDADYLTEAEADALFERYIVLRRKHFDEYVMREVLGADTELSSSSSPQVKTGTLRVNETTGVTEVYTGAYWQPVSKVVGGSNGQAHGTNVFYTGSGTWGQTQLPQQEAQRQAFMAQQQDAYK